MSDSIIVDNFHKKYYDDGVWKDTHWMGIPTCKCPLDLWIYQELIFKIRPHLIIETGTLYGGSAMYLSNICELIDHGLVVSVDIMECERKQHNRLKYIHGSSTSEEVIKIITGFTHHSPDIAYSEPSADQYPSELNDNTDFCVMVILDSDHSYDHVMNELNLYSKMVTVGSYIIVEDTNINGHPVLETFGNGPYEAVETFLKENKDYIIDKSCEKFHLSFNPSGFLKRIA